MTDHHHPGGPHPGHPDPHREQHEVVPPPGVESRPPREPRSLQYHALAGSKPQPAGIVLVIGVVAFLVAAVLNADSLGELANRQPVGWKRDAARAAVSPFCTIGEITRLKTVRAEIRDATDKASQDCAEEPASGADAFVAPETTTTAPPTSDASGTTATTEPPIASRTPTAEEPLRMWVGGDSMTIELAQSVTDAVTGREDIELSTHPQVSSGLSRPDYFDWPTYFQDEVLPGDPEVIAVMFGANDSQGLLIDGTAYQPDSPEWQEEYRRRVGVVMDQLRGEGRMVLWIGQPRMREAGFDERMGVLDEIYASEAESRPWVRFLDSRPVLSPDGGGYQAAQGDVDLRQPDGIHLDRGGADLLAEAVLAAVAEEFPPEGGG